MPLYSHQTPYVTPHILHKSYAQAENEAYNNSTRLSSLVLLFVTLPISLLHLSLPRRAGYHSQIAIAARCESFILPRTTILHPP